MAFAMSCTLVAGVSSMDTMAGNVTHLLHLRHKQASVAIVLQNVKIQQFTRIVPSSMYKRQRAVAKISRPREEKKLKECLL